MSSPASREAFGPAGAADGATRAVVDGLGADVQILGELGRSPQAVVYRMRRAGVEYALKRMSGVAPDDESVLIGFRREAALLARVDHPSVPRVFDVGLADGRPYLVMELVDGQSLATRLRSGPLDVGDLVRVGQDVASALHAAHRAGLVHRDIKPANIIVDASGRSRLIDFGLAAAGRLGVAGDSVVGTFEYCPPEQNGMLTRAVDGRADLYSLGVMLFECATGELPYQARDVGRLIAQHATAAIPDPRALRPDLPPALAELIRRLLAKDPDDRFQSGLDLLTALADPGSAGASGAPRPAPSTLKMFTRRPPIQAQPLVGRDVELNRLNGYWPLARAGTGPVVLLQGPAGVGKSALAETMAAAAELDGGLVLSGSCDPDSGLPLAPLRDAVDSYLRVVTALPDEQRTAAIEELRLAAGVDAGLLRPLSATLATLLRAPQLAIEDRHEQFAASVASFLGALARGRGGLLLLVDGAQWVDAASLDVLRQLVQLLPHTPALLLLTARDDAATAAEALVAGAAAGLGVRLPVPPLDERSAVELVTAYLGGSTVGRDVSDELLAHGRGNPFAIREFLHALIDAGALYPSWGSWRLDPERLQAIELPTDVVELVLARIQGLGGPAQDALTVGAVIGSRFEAETLAAVLGPGPADDLAPILAEATDRGVLRRSGDTHAFVHDRIRETLLSSVEPARLAEVHRRVADVLAGSARTEPAHVYALARHRAAGGLDHDPEQVFRTGWAAGRLALSENAPEAALAFLRTAAAGAHAAGIVPDSRFRESLAVAHLELGDPEGAAAELEPALAAETVPLRRAALLLRLSQVHRSQWQVATALDCIHRGLAELGYPVPANPVVQLVSTMLSLLRCVLFGGRRPAAVPVEGYEAERLRLHAAFCQSGSATAAINMRAALVLTFVCQAWQRVHRLGVSAEYIRTHSAMAQCVMAFSPRRYRQMQQTATALAAGSGDPALGAYVEWMDALTNYVLGRIPSARFAALAEKYRRYLDLDHYVDSVLTHARDLVARGYGQEALTWCRRAAGRVPDDQAEQLFGLTLCQGTAGSLLGQELVTAPDVSDLARAGHDPARALQTVIAATQMAVEQDELGEPLEQALAAFDQLRMPGTAFALFDENRFVFVWRAYGRLARCRSAEAPRRPELLAAAATAVSQLGRRAKGPLLHGYHVVARAHLCQLRGEPEAALAVLAGAEKDLVRLDAPLVQFEATLVRARALALLGDDAPARQNAQHAQLLAVSHGWVHRLRAVQSEFTLLDPASTRHGGSRPTRPTDGSSDRYRRRLEALQQVSAAAATVLDPQQLARVAMDETLRIIAAERAILFLIGPDGRPYASLGRTGTGELAELGGYPVSLVNRVATDRQPLVVTGSQEGAALGSRSTVVHGLRSIMIAPLELEGRLLGLVYLDSRVAKGVFTDDDIDILTAVASQIVVSLETARAARSEADVQAAQLQRDTAEALRQAMSELADSLDPDQVLDRLRLIAARTLGAQQVFLLHPDVGPVGDGPDRGPTSSTTAAELAALGPGTGDADTRPPALASLLNGGSSWLMTPLSTRGHGDGVLVAGSDAKSFSQAELDIATALASQGATAYANARLFAQVQQLATTDGLTGVFNRRHFTDLGRRQLEIAARNQRPLTAMMIDIDHFKAINDTYGHGTGDEVIRAVATVLQGAVRDPDVLGRYGGEEFAIVMSEMHGDPRLVAERLRAHVADLTVTAVPAGSGAHPSSGPITVTVSIGIAELKPDDDLDGLLARADEALYRAKQAGRNQVRSS